MASLRKRYADRVDAPPVTAPPTGAAKLPDPVADPKPPEMPATESPVDKAAKEAIALQLRLREMDRAEQLQKKVVQQPPPQAAEPQAPQQQPTLEDHIAHLPPRVQGWYRKHPEFATDPEKAAQVQYCHHVAAREVGEQFTEPYFDRMEQMLGLAPRTNGHAQQRPAPAAPRYESPPLRQRSAVPMSAPVSRDSPSMATGRPTGGPVRLTPAQQEAARFSGISEQEYARQLVKMERMKAAGEIDDNGRR